MDKICLRCEYCVTNDSFTPVRTPKGMLQPGKCYCEHKAIKHKVVSYRALGKYGFPIWCPLAEKKSCEICGTIIRACEGNRCEKCKKYDV
jgi:hypothetical protein